MPAALPRDAQLAAYERLGIARLRAGAPAEALEPLEKALALDPRRSRALETLVEAARAAGNDDAVVRHTQALLAVTDDPKTKLALLEHVATIHHERRHDPQRAIAAYLEALEIWPDERSIMHRLLELYTETKQWKQSVQLLARLAELTESRDARPVLRGCRQHPGRGARRARRGDRGLRAGAGRRSRRPQELRAHRSAGHRGARLEDAGTDLPPPDQAPRQRAPPEKRPGAGRALARPRRDLPDAAQGRAGRHRRLRGGGRRSTPTRSSAAGCWPSSIVWRVRPPTPRRSPSTARWSARAKTLGEMVPDLKMLVRLFVEMGTLDEAHAAAAALVVIGPCRRRRARALPAVPARPAWCGPTRA